jgi:energy-converting hydrogenase Eha subunit F
MASPDSENLFSQAPDGSLCSLQKRRVLSPYGRGGIQLDASGHVTQGHYELAQLGPCTAP